jgi:glutaminyl-peptide cyclotransferase
MTSPEQRSGEEILRLVEDQVARGPRVPGTTVHDKFAVELETSLRTAGADVTIQEFYVEFRAEILRCANVVGVFRTRADPPNAGPPVLLGTHFDTRPRADREPDLSRREVPIPGANDGGSGTAILWHMLPRLAAGAVPRDVGIAFFDAEDLGNIDGKEFSLGAAWLADHPLPGFTPRDVVVLDMVGGKGMIFDIDAHILDHGPSKRLTTEIFRLGIAKEWEPFAAEKAHRLKYIISDHAPFLRRGTAACILIDIDYPQWHTQADLPDAMSAASLAITEEALWLYLSRPPG